MDIVYTREDCGRYIDGALGIDHACARMAELLEPLGAEMAADTDALDALEDAAAILQDHTESGYVWLWEASDLVLVPNEADRRLYSRDPAACARLALERLFVAQGGHPGPITLQVLHEIADYEWDEDEIADGDIRGEDLQRVIDCYNRGCGER